MANVDKRIQTKAKRKSCISKKSKPIKKKKTTNKDKAVDIKLEKVETNRRRKAVKKEKIKSEPVSNGDMGAVTSKYKSKYAGQLWNKEKIIESYVIMRRGYCKRGRKPKKAKFRQNEELYICEYCSQVFISKHAIELHIKSHANTRYQCTQCDESFDVNFKLKRHMVHHINRIFKSKKYFICDYCNKPFMDKANMIEHITQHLHNTNYSCALCEFKFENYDALRKHEYAHKSALKYQCAACNSLFTNRSRLVYHIKSHLGIKDHVCYICGREFLRPDTYKKHLSSFHLEIKPYECPICNKKLKGHLREHVLTHEKFKPFACPECKKMFAQKTQLKVHMRSHSGLRPYKCRVCAKAFSHSNALILHIRRHTGERPIKCTMCPLTFAQLPHMKAHMKRIHNRDEVYRCKNCLEFFKLKDVHEKHVKLCQAKKDGSLQNNDEYDAKWNSDIGTPMSLSRMRFLLAILLRTIADDNRLRWLGFNKRLIDDLLIDALVSTNQQPCTDMTLAPETRLKINIQMFLNWTVPATTMNKFRRENKSTEELLEELTRI